ncbi:hypothetical protein I4I73_22440 [Pseudonocardia sp. KRD-184]|uniref:Uncharacterized protein n=1 Tax=Pseudonocardia oceani TaxID=2792013 RepID=A0ABS6U484_9PSEU|nr:hypothetical protein [Pseudonocardia oceani]MBW0091618.1 hypothetical protein [Pseudonocardia oceani]MBW0098751.1 hypothetical protein [Pseudonocardia oceani]MBW0109379.1 hypothetical protein [Pseudonocardia oceani]MBW0125138.1 hypothetical protein [Pseudonocardia oceani]MBW0127042.1 hypothetical protein [Pseudonocardia oceani]
MSTIDSLFRSNAAVRSPPAPVTPVAENDGGTAADAPCRGVLDRIADAVRAAHTASVPF